MHLVVIVAMSTSFYTFFQTLGAQKSCSVVTPYAHLSALEMQSVHLDRVVRGSAVLLGATLSLLT